MKKAKKLATLTVEQDSVWTKLFSSNVNSGMNERAADREAWSGLCEQFPELRAFDGAKVRVSSSRKRV